MLEEERSLFITEFLCNDLKIKTSIAKKIEKQIIYKSFEDEIDGSDAESLSEISIKQIYKFIFNEYYSDFKRNKSILDWTIDNINNKKSIENFRNKPAWLRNPDQNKKEIHNYQEKIILEENTISLNETTIYTCRCGNNRCVVRTVQTQSSDEGNTIFVTCLNSKCRRRWRG